MNSAQNAFLKLVVPAAQAAQKKWGVPASVTIAQSILESSNVLGWGKSELAVKANNYFGIKAIHLSDPSTYIEFKTYEYVGGVRQEKEADFVRYENLADSFDAHGQLLATALRYRPAMAVRNDPEAFCIQLQQCGYSTNPSYAVTLGKLIQDYGLLQYDIEPDGPAAAQVAA